jgi:histidinol-phosphate aminotransferase
MTKDRVFNISELVRENVRRMKPYSSARDEFKGEADVFLDANENPFPSPFNRYPDPLQWKIKEKLAAIKDVAPEQIFLGNGSDEAIDLLIRAFCEPRQDEILITEPTYGMYAVCADVNAVAINRVLLTPDYDLDVDATLNAISPNTKIIFLCSPNNPSAALLDRSHITRILETFNGIVVVDEAYIDFCTSPSWITELQRYPNLVVLQTFSKAWGLAALRCGMAYASTEIISILNKIKYPYNINIQTQELVLKALANEGQKNQWVSEILAARQKLVKELEQLSLVNKVFRSDANFVLVRVTDAAAIYEYLMNNGIIVRDRSRVTLCEGCLRITIGTPDENKKLIDALKSFERI